MPLIPIVRYELRLFLLANSLLFYKFYSFLPVRIGHKVKVRGRLRNDFFSVKEIGYLVVGLFHNLVQLLSKGYL